MYFRMGVFWWMGGGIVSERVCLDGWVGAFFLNGCVLFLVSLVGGRGGTVPKRKKYEIRLEPFWEREHLSTDCFGPLLGCVLCLCVHCQLTIFHPCRVRLVHFG